MMKYSIDRLLIFLLSPIIVALASILSMENLLYLNRPYTLIYFISFLIFYKLIKREHIYVSIFYPMLLVILTGLIEYIHYLTTGYSLDGLTDIRMILYSPLYGPIFVFTIYATYLSISAPVVREFHLKATLNLITWFSFFFIFYWLFLFNGYISKIDGFDAMNQNHYSYASLFVIFCLIYFKDRIHAGPFYYKFMMTTNVLVILLNTTRGAGLILILMAIHSIIGYVNRRSRFQSYSLIMIMFLALFYGGLTFNNLLLGDEFWSYFNEVIFSGELRLFMDYGSIMSLDLAGVSTGAISAITRALINVQAFILFLENYLFGVGAAYVYSIQVHDTGIHSFFLLVLPSIGIFGVILLSMTVRILSKRFGSFNRYFLILIFAFLVFQFQNYVSNYFVLFFILSSPAVFPIMKNRKNYHHNQSFEVSHSIQD